MRRAVIAAALLASGCASSGSKVVFLDGEDKAPPGAVAVLDPATGQERAVIDRADTLAIINAKGARQTPIPPAQAEDRDGALVKELPKKPVSFRLYYAPEKVEVLPSSEAARAEMFAEVARRPGVDVQIIGHTDRTDTAERNDLLSLNRAKAILEELTREGLDPSYVRATGRGERDATGPDGVPNAGDRYVEVVVR